MIQSLTRSNLLLQIKRNKVRFVKSCGLYACLFLIGFSDGIVGPTVIDLAIQTGSNLTMTPYILPFRAGGFLVSLK